MFTEQGYRININRDLFLGCGKFGNVYHDKDLCFKIFKKDDSFDLDDDEYIDDRLFDDRIPLLFLNNDFDSMVKVHNVLYNLPTIYQNMSIESIKKIDPNFKSNIYYTGYIMEYLNNSKINPLLDKKYFIDNYIQLLNFVYKMSDLGILLKDFNLDNSIITNDGIKIIDFDMYEFTTKEKALEFNLKTFKCYIASLIHNYFIKQNLITLDNTELNKLYFIIFDYINNNYLTLDSEIRKLDKPVELVRKLVK